LQGKKIAVADSALFSQKKNELVLRGRARAIFEKARAILRDDTVDKLRNPEAKKILKEKTVLTANEIILSARSGDARALGAVVVLQKGKEAKAGQAVYNEATEKINLTGNVMIKEEEEWVSAREVSVSVKEEVFEAVGSVEARFKL